MGRSSRDRPGTAPDPAPDLPAGAGPFRRLHLAAGSAAILVTDLFRPRLMLGVRLAAFDREGRVFLVRHSYVPGLYLPGGGVESGETARQAAVREAGEEGGLILAGPPDMFHIYFRSSAGRRDHVVLFVARDVGRGPRQPATRPEILDAGFFDPRDLPPGATPATRARLADVLDGAPKGDFW